MQHAFIVDAVRTPIGRGRLEGILSGVHPVDLLAQTLGTLVERCAIEPRRIEDIIAGCVTQAGEQAGGIGRMAALAAGFPVQVPAVTIDRKCGSGQQAITFAAQSVMSGMSDVVIACGVESMSRIRMGSAIMGMDPSGPAVSARFSPGLISQGHAAELVAARWKLSREEMDNYALRSHQRASACRSEGSFRNEIFPIVTPLGPIVIDETIRPSTTIEVLAGLQPSFTDQAIAARFPEIDWSVTAGNSSQISDGAAAMLIASERAIKALRLQPRARIFASQVIGADPVEMLTAPIPATRAILQRAGLRLHDIDHFEINEAFACVPLAWQAELHADPERVNPCGGAIALGHPLGASGVRLMTTMLNALERGGKKRGLQSMCEAGGMANATIIEIV